MVLPFIAAAATAAGIAWWLGSGSGDSSTASGHTENSHSSGPKHEPGRQQSQAEKEETARAAREAAMKRAKELKQEEQARLKMQAEKLKAEKRAAEAAKLHQEALKAQAAWKEKSERMAKEAAEKAVREEAERRRKEREEYPMPPFLSKSGGTKTVNWAVVGDSGQGKSSLINYIMDKKVANVGVGETTMEPTYYTVEGFAIKFWDLPGAGTKKFPTETYIRNMGLRYFDLAFILSAGRWKEHDLAIIAELKKHKVPHFVVRTKVDQDIENNLDDHDIPEEETLEQLRQESWKQGIDEVYLVTTKKSKLKRQGSLYDNQRLVADMIPKMAESREQIQESPKHPPPPQSVNTFDKAANLEWCSVDGKAPGRQPVAAMWNPPRPSHPNGTCVRMLSALARASRRR